MTKAGFGMLAGIAGAAFAAWWWQQRSTSSAQLTPAHERGEVIFSNAPIIDDTVNG